MPPDCNQQPGKTCRRTHASFGWILGATVSGAVLATVLFNRYAVVTLSMGPWLRLCNARNTLAGSVVGAAVGLLICLALSRWRIALRHLVEVVVAFAIVAWLLSKYYAEKADYEQERRLWIDPSASASTGAAQIAGLSCRLDGMLARRTAAGEHASEESQNTEKRHHTSLQPSILPLLCSTLGLLPKKRPTRCVGLLGRGPVGHMSEFAGRLRFV